MYRGLELILDRRMALLMHDVAVSIRMVNKTLLPSQYVETPFKMVLHLDIDLNFGPGELRGYQLSGFRIPGQNPSENLQVRTLWSVENPPYQTVFQTKGGAHVSRKTPLALSAPSFSLK